MSDIGLAKEELEVTSKSNRYYRHYVLFILMLTYASSYMDRQIVAILLENIKAEFGLSDTQLGLLSGLAFALFYSILGIPIARLADRHNRTKIIACAVGLWSIVTVLCGMANNFAQLFIARIGVGVGEAGGLAPAHSLISDYYSAGERSIALSIYSLGTVIGVVLGLSLGGYIAENYGWRYAFIAAGAPGVILALLVFTSIKEPIRGALDRVGGSVHMDDEHLPFMTSLRELWRSKAYLYSSIGHVFGVFFAYALSSWLPTLFMRQYEMSQSAVGGVVGAIFFSGGVPGLLAGGYLADRLGKRSPKWRAYVPALGIALAVPFFLIAFNTASMQLAVVMFCFGNFFLLVHHAPGLAIVQIVIKPKGRAFAVAILYFFSNIIGLALGPLYVGAVSDSMSSEYGNGSLAIALMTIMPFLSIAIWGYWKAAAELDKS